MTNACPQCGAQITNHLLYKCMKCFTVYCKECDRTNGGRYCPRCGMSHRILLTTEEK